jgi:hypothetical protein
VAIYYAKQQIEPGTYSLPLLISDDELLVSTLSVPGFGAANTVTISVQVHWEKPLLSDIGQLDLLLRYGGEHGAVLAESEATCYVETTSKLTYSGPCQAGNEATFTLLAKSIDRRALVTGPITFEITVK